MEIRADLKKLYGDYYLNDTVLIKRRIAARQTLEHLNLILPRKDYGSILDIGAGDGSVLEELNNANIGDKLHAVEISESGCNSIRKKALNKVCSVEQFDGYNIPAEEGQYELGLAVHVLEHVEHERTFLYEISRTCKYLYIEVPLELTLNVNKNINISSHFGHINFYNAYTFQNLLNSCGLEVLEFKQFPPTLEYEIFLGGAVKGRLKHLIRKLALKLAPKVAPLFITYMGSAYCRLRPVN
jgi:ubiquinone/menaquinone biosynthesis C-methylase UbiE